MKDNIFCLSFEKEQPFSPFQRIKGVLKDDTGYHVIIEGGYAVLIDTQFIQSVGRLKYPWTYTFEVR